MDIIGVMVVTVTTLMVGTTLVEAASYMVLRGRWVV